MVSGAAANGAGTPGQAATETQPGWHGAYYANMASDWVRADQLLETKERVELHVTGYNRGGLLVKFGGLQGFVPASQLCELPKDPNNQTRECELACRVGDQLCLRVIEIDHSRNRLILSERAAISERDGAALLESLSPGQVRSGRVNSLCGFGAFVDLGGVEGFIHISEFSWGRVNHPSDMLSVGAEMEVYIIDVQPEQSRVALSLKRLQPDPWTLVNDRYSVGDIIEGDVTNVVSFGAFVRIEEGLEGLIHISELAEGNFLHPRNVVEEGDRVRARIIRIDGGTHRLGLSLRQVE
jgi:small subunit ribosomal protein S1